jgi:hypothetical protein
MSAAAQGEIKRVIARTFGQPMGQAIPQDFLAMLAELDRSKR